MCVECQFYCVLSVNHKTPLVLSETKLITFRGDEWFVSWPCDGDFACESDRPKVTRILNTMLDQKDMLLLKNGDLVRFRLLRAITSRFKLGHACTRTQSTEAALMLDFLEHYKFDKNDSRSTDGFSPLMVACIGSEDGVIRALLRSRADAQQRMTGILAEDGIMKGSTPLALACRAGNVVAAECLLDARVDPNCDKQDANGSRPLHVAADRGHVAVTALLLDKFADVNGRNAFGMDPLICAVCFSRQEASTLLLQWKANPLARCVFGSTALGMACNTDAGLDVIRLLMAHGAEVNTRGSPHGIGKLFVHGSHLGQRLGTRSSLVMTLAANKSPPLFCAVLNASPLIVQALLEHRADPMARNYDGLTALGFAQRLGRNNICRLLDGSERPEPLPAEALDVPAKRQEPASAKRQEPTSAAEERADLEAASDSDASECQWQAV